MSRLSKVLSAALLGAMPSAVLAADIREVPLQVEPAQRIVAIVLESNGTSVPVTVTNGKAMVPAELPLPWKVAQLRFEPVVYTRADLDAQRPLMLRELGRIRGSIREGGREISHDFVLLVRPTGTTTVDERRFTATPASGGAFELAAPAGPYQTIAASDTCGTRLRSGIIVKPGTTTDLGVLACDPTFAISFRVIDAKTSAPVQGAKVVWDPPSAVNAEDARVMYASRWSAATDRRGSVTFKVGPLPIPVRWRVEAPGYAVERTARIEVLESRNMMAADVKLRPATALRVRVHLPDDRQEFAGGALALLEPTDEHLTQYVTKARQPLHDGENTFRIDTFGPKRIWMENAAGTKLCYRDINVQPEAATLDFSPQPIEIRGLVTRGGQGLEKAVVVLGAPREARSVLAKAETDVAGGYLLTTYQSGELTLYATQYGRNGLASMGAVIRKLRTTVDRNDYQLDFESPAGGVAVSVADAETHAPVQHARIKAGFKLDKGTSLSMAVAETDETGKATLVGYSEGVASLDVSAPGYRNAQVELPFRGDSVEEHDITLTHSQAITGRIIAPNGAPVAGALITAAYDDEFEMQPRFQTVSNGAGAFRFDSPPEPGTTFYIIAAGWALSVTNLQAGSDNVVTLASPATNVLYLTEDNAPPKRTYRVNAAPLGGNFIPSGVLDDLAQANGMNTYQLLGSSRDGAVALPEFLAPGVYDFFITLPPQRGQPLMYERVGRVTLPSQKADVLRLGSK